LSVEWFRQFCVRDVLFGSHDTDRSTSTVRMDKMYVNIISNFVSGYLSKVQGLNENRDSFKAPRRDYTSGDANRRPQLGSGRDDRLRNRGNNVNVHFVRRQTDRRNSNCSI
jgi:hypothetical protein